MFRRQADGVEIYFNWPSKTARVVPSRSVRVGIQARDSLAVSLLSLGFLLNTLKAKDLAIWVLVALGICLVERLFYVSKLKKVPLHVSSAQVDQAYIRERSIFDGVLLTIVGFVFTVLLGLGLLRPSENALPLVIGVPLLAAALMVGYVGVRILVAKRP
jgi:hypothetical protein